MAYDVGQMVRLPVLVKNDAGVATDATMAITVTKPDETILSPAPTIVDDPGVGAYHADVTVDAAGPWRWRYAASGAVVGVYTGQFFVRLDGLRIVSLAEAKRHLNKDPDITTDDEEIRDWIDVARWVIEREVGATVPRQVVDYLDGTGRSKLFVRTRPVLDVSEVRESPWPGEQYTLAAEPDSGVGVSDRDYRLIARENALQRRSYGQAAAWPRGSGNIKVTYRAGRPTDIFRAPALELISHLWRASQLGSGRAPSDGGAELFAAAYALPNRVREMLPGRKAPLIG